MIEHYNKHIDSSVLSKLVVAKEDTANKKIILKATSAFYDYYVRNNYIEDLDKAFKAQGFTFESLLGIFPAACGVIWRNEQIYT